MKTNKDLKIEIAMIIFFMVWAFYTGYVVRDEKEIEKTDPERNWIYNQGYIEGRIDMYNECQISLDDQYWSTTRKLLHGDK